MKFILIFYIFLSNSLFSDENYSESTIKKMIANMIILGFKGEEVSPSSQIYKDIKSGLGGVILFDKDPNNNTKIKNIKNPKQLKKLTKQLQEVSKEKLLISTDQEGGRVQRLNSKNGFFHTITAKKMGKKDLQFAKKSYEKLAKMLHNNGINLNFAPVVDMAINKKNKVIFKLARSYGKESETIKKYAEVFIDEQNKQNVISVLKHFPGHGSSLKDSHKGFVDISNTWREEELNPYKYFIKNKKAKVIMTAHIFNNNLDTKYPATLSYKTNTLLLRKKLSYDGVIISDDLQMNAIKKHYTLEESLKLAINSGVNILLFANQQAKPIKLNKIVNIIYKQIKNGSIPLKNILESKKRIDKLLGM